MNVQPDAQSCESARKLPARMRKEALLSGKIWGVKRCTGSRYKDLSNLMDLGTHEVQRKTANVDKILHISSILNQLSTFGQTSHTLKTLVSFLPS